MDKETLEYLLCISGYLPPRNEEELEEFEKEFSKVEVKQKIHIDIDKNNPRIVYNYGKSIY